MDFVIQVDHVTYSYPLAKEPALKQLNVGIERGKFYGVIGENGAGKTSFCALLRGFIPEFYKGNMEGKVLVEGKAISEYGGNIASKIGYVFQNPFTQISGVKDTVFEEVAYGLENMGVPVEEIEKRVVDVMRMTDIEALAEKNPFDLSGGQMQRVALASVIVLEPDILVIDEPTSQLDPEGTESVIDLIAEYADEVLVFKDGEIIALGDKQKILSDMSLAEKDVALPQVAILGNKLKQMGLPITEIPVTEKEAVEIIRKALKERGM